MRLKILALKLTICVGKACHSWAFSRAWTWCKVLLTIWQRDGSDHDQQLLDFVTDMGERGSWNDVRVTETYTTDLRGKGDNLVKITNEMACEFNWVYFRWVMSCDEEGGLAAKWLQDDTVYMRMNLQIERILRGKMRNLWQSLYTGTCTLKWRPILSSSGHQNSQKKSIPDISVQSDLLLCVSGADTSVDWKRMKRWRWGGRKISGRRTVGCRG